VTGTELLKFQPIVPPLSPLTTTKYCEFGKSVIGAATGYVVGPWALGATRTLLASVAMSPEGCPAFEPYNCSE
jgi:hypothetical protein